MNSNLNALAEYTAHSEESFDFDELEKQLAIDLENQMIDLDILKDDHVKIGNPETLGQTVMSVVWEQFINQVGVVAGEDFIAENRNLKLDLRNSAHIQTTENFAKGKLATHNDEIDYKERHKDWQSKFKRDDTGNIKTHSTRTGEIEANLVSGARDSFDKGRPTGSAMNKTDMDHTVPAAEIIRDPATNAHLSQKEQHDFANSEFNLNEIDSSLNRSKSDSPTTAWLDNPNRNGQKPSEIFDISEKQEQQLRKKDKEARTEYEKQKVDGERRSIETGKQSQKNEAFRIGGKALRSVIMGLLAELIKKIIHKLVSWFRSGKKKLSTFLTYIKDAIMEFICNIKDHLRTAARNIGITIAIADGIMKPVIAVVTKAWIFLKQGYQSVKSAVNYIKSPENKNKPFSLIMLEIGKIVVAGLTVGGALILGEVIEKALMTIPVFAFPIPMLGSLASVSGIFFGALVSGIIGALVLNLIDKAIANKQKTMNNQQQMCKRNDILLKQDQAIVVAKKHLDDIKLNASNTITERHKMAEGVIRQSMLSGTDQNIKEKIIDNNAKLDKLFNTLDNL